MLAMLYPTHSCFSRRMQFIGRVVGAPRKREPVCAGSLPTFTILIHRTRDTYIIYNVHVSVPRVRDEQINNKYRYREKKKWKICVLA